MDDLIKTGAAMTQANNMLMLMLTGDIALTKPSLESAIRRSLDARNAWDNAVKDATPGADMMGM